MSLYLKHFKKIRYCHEIDFSYLVYMPSITTPFQYEKINMELEIRRYTTLMSVMSHDFLTGWYAKVYKKKKK